MYRASTGDLSLMDEGSARGGGERWDRDRFERMRGQPPRREPPRREPPSRDNDYSHYRFSEHDRFPGGRRDVDIHEDNFDRRRPPPPVAERERFHDKDRFSRPRRPHTELFDEPTASEVANQALAPYRRKSVVDKDISLAIKRPARPGYLRRQSSLDTFDRPPPPRFHDHHDYEHRHYEHRDYDRDSRDEWRPPTNVPIPLPIRERRRSPPRRFHDDGFEDVRYREVERERERTREPPRGRDEEYREVEIRREKSTRRARSRSRAARSIAATSVRSSSSSSFEDVAPVRTTVGRKGKTRMPKRLVKKQAVIDLGYPFEEEDDFIIVRRALEKDHIDEIIKISESYKEEKTTYVFNDGPAEPEPFALAPPPPPPPPASFAMPPPQNVHYAQPPPSVHYAQSQYAQSARSVSPSRHGHEVYEERIEQSNHIGGPLTVLVPEEQRRREQHEERQVMRIERDTHVHRDSRTKRELEEEIRALEAERQMLKYERETDYEFVEKREPRKEVVRVEKDRKVRREPNPKLVAAMLATLS